MTRSVDITHAEALVLRELLRDGAWNPVIAKRLTLSLETVKTHMKVMMAKAGAANRTELVLLILREEVTLTVPRRHIHDLQRLTLLVS